MTEENTMTDVVETPVEIEAPRRGRPPKATVDAKKNTHHVAVYIGDDRKIEPGETIPDDVDDETRAALIATGFFE